MSAEQHKRWKQEQIRKGLCIYCSQPHMAERKVCVSHYEAGREYKRNWERRQRELLGIEREEVGQQISYEKAPWFLSFDCETTPTVFEMGVTQ